MSLRARTEHEVPAPQRAELVGMDATGTVLLASRRDATVVRPDGASMVLRANGVLLGSALSRGGRLALLEAQPTETGPWPAAIRVFDPSGHQEMSFDARFTASLAFHYGTGGALAWGDDSLLWIVCSHDGSSDDALWVGAYDVDTRLLRGAPFEAPDSEPRPHFAHPISRGGCELALDGGQHGGWAYSVSASDDDGLLEVRPACPGEHITHHARGADGTVWALDGYELVHFSSAGERLASLPLSARRFPVSILPAAAERVLVASEDGALSTIDLRAMSETGAVSFDDATAVRWTVGGPDLFVTSLVRGAEQRPMLRWWRLPDA